MIILVQHGETLSRSEKIMIGQGQDTLTDTGIKTAYQYAEALSGIQFDRMYTSELSVAIQTARIIMDRQIEMILMTECSSLNEPSAGQYENRSYSVLKKLLPPREYRLWDRDYFVAPPAGESMADAGERVREWLRKEKLEGNWTGNILIVVGPSVMKILLGEFQSLDESDILELEPHLIPYSFDA